MGTSKAKINNKVKDLLKDVPIEKIDERTPEISKNILSIRNLKKEFLDEEIMESCVETIQVRLKALFVEGMNGKPAKEIIQDEIGIAEFIDSVLEEIDKDDCLFVEKDILEKSFKITMAECVKDEIVDVESLVLKLLYNTIKQLLIGDLNDTLKIVYEDLSFDQIEKMAINVTEQIMNESIKSTVHEYLNKELSFEKILAKITEETNNVTFGEF